MVGDILHFIIYKNDMLFFFIVYHLLFPNIYVPKEQLDIYMLQYLSSYRHSSVSSSGW